MKKYLLLLLLSFGMQAQTDANSAFMSRKGVYQIKFDTENWTQDFTGTAWDAQFLDKYNLVTAYFSEFDYFIPDDKLKETVKSQFDGLGNVKNLKINKKTINGLVGNYFECELLYNDYLYKYEGFIYNGKGGAVELQFAMQAEGATQLRAVIDGFYNSLTLVK